MSYGCVTAFEVVTAFELTMGRCGPTEGINLGRLRVRRWSAMWARRR